jgi:Transcriptional regulators
MKILEQRGISPQEVVQLADILLTLHRLLMFQLSSALAEGQVSFPQFFLLGQVGADEVLSMSEIADKMNHTTAAATGLVDRLEKLGYVERTTSPNDRRKVLVRITSKGRALVEVMRQDMIERLNNVLGELTAEEQRMWLQIYTKIIAYCQSQPSTSRS